MMFKQISADTLKERDRNTLNSLGEWFGLRELAKALKSSIPAALAVAKRLEAKGAIIQS